jgi:hypothetical protein
MLTAQDFVDEQAYYLNKIALLTRCIAGYGVVCGLVVTSNPEPRQLGQEGYKAPDEYGLTISPGVAVDPRGRELVLREPLKDQSLRSLMIKDDLQRYDEGGKKPFSLYLTIEYSAKAAGEQKQPFGGCCDQPRTIPNRWEEEPCFRLTFEGPPTKPECHSCGEPANGTRLWLAELRFAPAQKPILDSIDNTIRRPLSTYQPTRISGVNWLHTGVYEEEMAECLLNHGLIIEFSAPIDEQSISNHTVRLQESGKFIETNDIVEIAVSDELDIQRSTLQILQSRIEPLPDPNNQVRRIRIKAESRRLSPPQRILITVRTEFILDSCCQPVDGSNRGGFTDFIDWETSNVKYSKESHERTLADYKKRVSHPTLCECWLKTHPLTTGNGVHGSNFQSWFYVVGDGCLDQKPAQAE